MESTLIWYKGTDYENFKVWTESLTEFLNGTNKSLTHPPPPRLVQGGVFNSVGRIRIGAPKINTETRGLKKCKHRRLDAAGHLPDEQ